MEEAFINVFLLFIILRMFADKKLWMKLLGRMPSCNGDKSSKWNFFEQILKVKALF